MEENVKISLVVPVYNSEKYLDRCIMSILNQNYHNFELILINDGSNDKSGEICDLYAGKDDRVIVIHQVNSGVSSARNMGLKKATGDYIAFIDSDDWVNNTYIEDFFNRGQIIADICIQGYIIDYEAKSKSKTIGFPISKLYKNENISEVFKFAELNNINNSPCWKLFKASIIKENDLFFDEMISYGEDHLFVLNYYLYVRSVSVVSKEGYHYEQKISDSLTTIYVKDDKIYYYGINSYELRKKNILEFQINDLYFKNYVEKQLAINILNAIASLYHTSALTNKENRAAKIIGYKNIIDNLQLVKDSFNGMYFYKYMIVILSDCRNKDLLLNLLIKLRVLAVKFKIH